MLILHIVEFELRIQVEISVENIPISDDVRYICFERLFFITYSFKN